MVELLNRVNIGAIEFRGIKDELIFYMARTPLFLGGMFLT